jgi:hypothetical protein
MITPTDVARHLGTKVLRPKTVEGRRYFDAWTTPSCVAGRALVSTPECEHCDGERSRYVRIDDLRGYVCPDCDSSLDEMFDEQPPGRGR